MSLHPDADALIRAFLDRPTDDTPRLVLADWLDDTGLPENAAWAGYLRACCQAARLTAPSPERAALLLDADRHAAGITLTLTVPAERVVHAPDAFLALLPADRLTVAFDGFVLPAALAEVVPESVARTNRVVSLSPWGDRLILATADPSDREMAERLEFILNRPIVFLRAAADEIDRAIEASYPFSETESVTEELLVFPPQLPSLWPVDAGGDTVALFVDAVLTEAVRLGASWVEIRPVTIGTARVWYRVEGDWIDREPISGERLPAVVDQLARSAGLAARADGTYPGSGIVQYADRTTARFSVVIEPTPFGPWVGVERLREPAAPASGP